MTENDESAQTFYQGQTWWEAEAGCPECGSDSTATDGQRLKCLDGCGVLREIPDENYTESDSDAR